VKLKFANRLKTTIWDADLTLVQYKESSAT